MTDISYEKLKNGVELCVTKEHRFGTDAFLLADFSDLRHKDRVCDLGTGCGIIPMLMEIKFSPKEIFCVDIQEQAIEQLKLSMEKSSANPDCTADLSKLHPICADLKELWDGAPLGQLDVVTCNPPYKAASCGIESELDAQKIARHEIMCGIDDVCRAADRLLKFGGKLCLCNRPERLADVISAMKANHIEPKTLRFVSKTPETAPWLFLIEGKKGSKPFMKVLPQLYINGENGFSDELMRIYGQEVK